LIVLASTRLASADPNPSRANAEKPWAMVHVSAPECGANAFRVNAFLHLLDVELMGERLRTTKDDDAGRSVELTVTIDGAVCDAMSRDLAIRLRTFPPAAGYLGQIGAISKWSAFDRLDRITAPTLVIHGETDQLVPPENGRILASRISGAKLVTLANASHLFTTDKPEESHAAILGWLHL